MDNGFWKKCDNLDEYAVKEIPKTAEIIEKNYLINTCLNA